MSNVRHMPLTDEAIRRAFEQYRADLHLTSSRVAFVHQKVDGVLAVSNTQTRQIGQLQDDVIDLSEQTKALRLKAKALETAVSDTRIAVYWLLAGWLLAVAYILIDLFSKHLGG